MLKDFERQDLLAIVGTVTGTIALLIVGYDLITCIRFIHYFDGPDARIVCLMLTSLVRSIGLAICLIFFGANKKLYARCKKALWAIEGAFTVLFVLWCICFEGLEVTECFLYLGTISAVNCANFLYSASPNEASVPLTT